ncbi:MAG: C40 family peptidase [Candidatus Omnitrophota bacterium]|jgi:cell wall-associated NlpC family hydrolase
MKRAVTVLLSGFLIVTSQSADIRKEPRDREPGYAHDDLNETQALFNEVLLHKFSKDGWFYVEALEQKEFTHNSKWQGYPGYIRKEKVRFVDDPPAHDLVINSPVAAVFAAPAAAGNILFNVSSGTKFETAGREGDFYKVRTGEKSFGWVNKKDAGIIHAAVSEDILRKNIVESAGLFLGIPYLWGGRDPAEGIDCSGLTNLAYRANGIDIPRDAHEQWMSAEKINAAELKPADLIFLSGKKGVDSIVHVMLFTGGENFIEAPGTGGKVRPASFREKFGMGLEGLSKKNFTVNGKKVHFGRIKLRR